MSSLDRGLVDVVTRHAAVQNELTKSGTNDASLPPIRGSGAPRQSLRSFSSQHQAQTTRPNTSRHQRRHQRHVELMTVSEVMNSPAVRGIMPALQAAIARIATTSLHETDPIAELTDALYAAADCKCGRYFCARAHTRTHTYTHTLAHTYLRTRSLPPPKLAVKCVGSLSHLGLVFKK